MVKKGAKVKDSNTLNHDCGKMPFETKRQYFVTNYVKFWSFGVNSRPIQCHETSKKHHMAMNISKQRNLNVFT